MSVQVHLKLRVISSCDVIFTSTRRILVVYLPFMKVFEELWWGNGPWGSKSAPNLEENMENACPRDHLQTSCVQSETSADARRLLWFMGCQFAYSKD